MRRLHGPLTPAPDEWQVQECHCRSARRRAQGLPDPPRWGQDDTATELCRCCANEALWSGHRFATWFCTHCREQVRAYNARVVTMAIPVGRHTAMAGIGPSGATVDLPGEVERFTLASIGLFEAVGRLQRRVGPLVRDRLTALGFAEDAEPTLAEYLAAGRACHIEPGGAVARLLGYSRPRTASLRPGGPAPSRPRPPGERGRHIRGRASGPPRAARAGLPAGPRP